MDLLSLPAAHLDLSPGRVAEDQFLRWIGGSPQDGGGPLFRIGGCVWIPQGSVVEIPDPPHGSDPGWISIAYPPDARERYAALVEIQKRAKELASNAVAPTRHQAIAAGMPEDWEMIDQSPCVSFWSTGNLNRDDRSEPYRSGFIVLSPEGLWFYQSFRSAPWTPGAPWGDWSRFRVVCAESTALLRPVQTWRLERWDGLSWTPCPVPGRGLAGGDWIETSRGLRPCGDSKDLSSLLSGFNPYAGQLPTGGYPVETKKAVQFLRDAATTNREHRPSRYPQIPGLGTD